MLYLMTPFFFLREFYDTLISNVVVFSLLPENQRLVIKLIFLSFGKFTTKKTKISDGYLVRENVKSLFNSVTKFCDQEICEEFHFFRH